jgi:uncharacterized protein
MTSSLRHFMLRLIGICALLLLHLNISAQDKDFPSPSVPPRLVNDYGHFLTEGEQSQLEQKLDDYARSSSTQITIVTVTSIGEYDIADYAVKLGKAWGIGKKGKDNGVLILASKQERKINISTGKGLEGALPDITCIHIIRNEITPSFKQGQFFQGFSKGADAVIAASKGEYKADEADEEKGGWGKAILIIIIIFIVLIFRMFGGGRGGGNYMSGRGSSGFGTGFIIGSILGNMGGGNGGGGNDSGFGGFGGGDFGGGGASGSW